MDKNKLHIIINDQVRKVDFYAEKDTIYLFDSHGDSIGYKFESDDLK